MFAQQRCVAATVELARIRALPRRVLTPAIAKRRAAELTEVLALRKGVELMPSQGIALHEFVKHGGVIAQLAVGQGKTIICETAPVLLAEKLGRSIRSVLFAPASLEDKTRHTRRKLSRDWRIASPPPRWLTKELLSRQSNAYLLNEIDPDLVMIDELDDLANGDASTAKRIGRFVREKRARGKAKGLPWPYGCWVLGATGTLSRNSAMGYWHFLEWVLGPERMPMPAGRAEAELWAAALDNGSYRGGWRPDPGALGPSVKAAREWFSARLAETPGVILWEEDSAADIPLRIRFKVAPKDRAINRAFKKLRERFESAGGEQVTDNLSMIRLERQEGQGLYTYYDPPPPPEWRAARSEFARFVRRRIAESARSQRPLDTEAMVIQRHPDARLYSEAQKREVYPVREWVEIKDTYDADPQGPNAHVEWLSTSVLEWVGAWAIDDSKGPRVTWCGSIPFAERLAKLTGLPYYGREGKEWRTGRGLYAADPRKSLISSWHANKRGFDLQPWRTQGIVDPPQSGKFLEQTIGRAHRRGQTARVTIVIFLTSGLTLDVFESAKSEATHAKVTTRLTQKILRADIQPFPELPSGLRWVRKGNHGE